MQTVAIIDYGMGNLLSMAKAVEHVSGNMRVLITNRSADIRAASRIIVPGQGHFSSCLDSFKHDEILGDITEAAKSIPFLGICVGMQMLFDESDEGRTEGLHLFSGKVIHFPQDQSQDLKIPHMGWNRVHQTQQHPLWQGIAQDDYFYFANSYYVQPQQASITAATSTHGITFTCAIADENIVAVQFHPEKSGQNGLNLLQNFLQWSPT